MTYVPVIRGNVHTDSNKAYVVTIEANTTVYTAVASGNAIRSTVCNCLVLYWEYPGSPTFKPSLHLGDIVFKMDNDVENTANVTVSSDTKEIDEKKNEAVEGGWGYAVCFGMMICFISGIGHINSFGLIYNDFIISTHSTAKSMTTAHGTFGMMIAVGGIILNVIAHSKYSIRLGGFIGATMFCVGSFLTIFITNTNQLPLTFGVLQGIGFGIIVPVCYSTVNFYFVRKRITVMSFCKAIQGVVLMWYPQLIKKIIVNFGFKGTLLIISAISLHMFPGVAVMKTHENNQRNNAANALESRKNDKESVDLLHCTENDLEADNKVKTKETSFIHKILCLKVLRDPIYVNICVGQSFVNFSDFTFFMLQPMLLFQYGYDQSEVATCISIGAGADVAGRFTLALISGVTSLNTRLIFYVATFFTLIMRIVMLQVQQFLWMAMATATLGMLRAWLHVASPLVISSHVTHQDFPGAYALFLLAGGLVNMTCSPLVGWLKDVYQDYVPAFYALSTCCLPCLIFWPVEYTRRK